MNNLRPCVFALSLYTAISTTSGDFGQTNEVPRHAVIGLQVAPATADDVSKLGEQCADMIRSYAGMPSLYMQQIGDLSLAKQWKSADIPVLVIYGTSDPATSADESRYLVEIINSSHPGRASYVELPGGPRFRPL
jgi:pimeloyl-ACP methyl ester carboxylesterase